MGKLPQSWELAKSAVSLEKWCCLSGPWTGLICPLSEHPGTEAAWLGHVLLPAACRVPWSLLQGGRAHGVPARSLEASPQSHWRR